VDPPKSRFAAAKHLEVVKSSEFNRSFIRECAILCECRHEHVLEFVGISYGKVDNALVLVTEYCPQTLKGIVLGDGALKYQDVLCMAREVACGMAYLHTKKVRK
jgi:serine/threonine protein kinase